MNKTLAAAAVLSIFTAPAVAADIFVPLSPLVVYNWTGAYVGAHLGYQSGQANNLGLDPRGALGGVLAGYNWQTGQFVFGAEADIQVSAADDTFAAYKFSNPWFGTVRGRAGFAVANMLLYATAGIVYSGDRIEFAGLSESQTHFGWTAGAGLAFAVTSHWSAKAEYLFVAHSSDGYRFVGGLDGIDAHLVRLGINYRF